MEFAAKALRSAARGSRKLSKYMESLADSFATEECQKRPSTCGTTWYEPSGWVESSVELELSVLVAAHDNAIKEIKETQSSLQARWKSLQADWNDDDAESLCDNAWLAHKVERPVTLFHLVSLFHFVEVSIGELLERRLTGIDARTAEQVRFQVHQWDPLKVVLKKWCGVDRHRVACVDDINELRLLCNAIKHSGGRVSGRLARTGKRIDGSAWIENDLIEPGQIDLARLQGAIPKFLVDLTQQAELAAQEKFGPPKPTAHS